MVRKIHIIAHSSPVVMTGNNVNEQSTATYPKGLPKPQAFRNVAPGGDKMKCNPNFVLREIYGKSLLMPMRRNEIGDEPIHLNTVATMIWKKAEESSSPDELIKNISRLYGLPSDSAEQTAIKQFVDQLIQMSLLSD